MKKPKSHLILKIRQLLDYLHSLKATLMLVSLGMVILLLILINITTRVVVGEMVITESKEHESNTLKQIAQHLDLTVDNLDSKLWMLKSNPILRDLLNQKNTPGDQRLIEQRTAALSSDVLNNFRTEDAVDIIMIMGRNDYINILSTTGATVSTENKNFNYHRFASDRNISPYFLSQTAALYYKKHYSLALDDPMMEEIHSMMEGRIVFMSTVWDSENIIIGSIFLVMQESFLPSVVKPFHNEQHFTLTDESNKLLWSNEGKEPIKGATTNEKNISLSIPLEPFEITLTSRVPYSAALKSLPTNDLTSNWILFIGLCYVLLVSYYLAHVLCTPLNQLTNSISADIPIAIEYNEQSFMRFASNLSMHTTLVLYFVITVTVPVLFFTSFYGVLNYKAYQKQVFDHAFGIINQVKLGVDNRLEYLSDLSRYLASDKAVMQLQYLDAGEQLDDARLLVVDQLSRNARILNNQLLSVNIYALNGNSLYSSLYLDNQSIMAFSRDFMVKMKNAGDQLVYLGTSDGMYPGAPMLFCRQLLTPISKMKYGYITLLVNQAALGSMTQNIRLNQSGYFFIMSQDGGLIAHDNQIFTETLLMHSKLKTLVNEPSGFAFMDYNNQAYYILHATTSQNDMHVVGLVPRRELLLRITPMILIISLLCLGYFGLSLGAAYFAARRIIRPLKHLHNMMVDVEAGIWDSMEYKGKNEIGILVLQYNRMVMRLGELITENYKVRLHESRLLLAGKEAQLKALQQQINPHFLYNTLDAIKWMAHKRGAREAHDMAVALGNFYRGVITRGHDVIPLSEELEHLQNYIYIQKIRFGDRFEVKWEIDQTTLTHATLKLVLQPLVENSIVHGMEDLEDNGLIIIRIKRVNDRLCFEVEDNGGGMDEIQLYKLNEQFETAHPEEESTSIGLINVFKRLKLNFGASANLSIRSEKDKGTCVQVLIPWDM